MLYRFMPNLEVFVQSIGLQEADDSLSICDCGNKYMHLNYTSKGFSPNKPLYSCTELASYQGSLGYEASMEYTKQLLCLKETTQI